MYQTITVAQHELPKELIGLRIVLKYNPIDYSQPVIETSLDSEFGTVRISEVLEDESLLLNEIRDVYFEIRDLKMKESINSPYTEVFQITSSTPVFRIREKRNKACGLKPYYF